jgi:hypothetical protein
MIWNTGAPADAGNPEVDRARLSQTDKDAGEMHGKRNRQHPDRTEDEEKLCGDDAVDDEIVVRHPREHLRAGQRSEKRCPVKRLHRVNP